MLKTIFTTLVALTLFLALCIAFIFNGSTLESRWFPVNTQWTPTSLVIDGDDLIVSGTVVKTRACAYIPPVRVRDEAGRNLLVLSSSSTANQSWAVSKDTQTFGPWRISGGAGKTLTFFQEHNCHAMWNVFSFLGTIKSELP